MKKVVLLLAAACWLQLAFSQGAPSPRQFLGYEVGEKFTPHYKMVGYFEALAKAEPGRVKLVPYGHTNEGRPLMLVFISSAENMAKLEEIRQTNLGLVNGTQTTGKAAIVWMSYNVHGNEASSSEAVMKTAYELVTSSRASAWLKNTVVVLDPCINPDGRDRYVNWFNSVVGNSYNPMPMAREHMEPWPGGRSNHYNFDLNRDWAWQTQIETRQRLVQYLQWMPHVHVDFHEQGYNEPYYFAPAAEPLHEVITPWQRDFQTQIGRNHAKYFDQQGWLYFTKERFDLFYPSYGDTWPTYNGGIGMTYEQGGHSRGGLGVINEDGDTLTLVDRANHHHTTGMSTVEISSLHAAELTKNFQQYFAQARANGAGEYKSYVIKAKGNEPRMKALMTLLQRNGIEYGYANGGTGKGFNYVSGKEESFPLEKGDIVIGTHQSRGAMVKVLFEPTGKLADSATYDITAWAVPYAYGLQAYAVREKLASVPQLAVPAVAVLPVYGSYGYVKSWKGMDDARYLAACLSKGIKVRVAERPFEVNGRKYDAGSLIFLRTSNHGIKAFDSTLWKIAQEQSTHIDAVSTGFMDKGADFGSPDVKTVHAPRVAMVTGDAVSSLSAGQVWYYFEHELQYPITLINSSNAGSTNWKLFDVVIVPSGFNFRGLLDRDGALKQWVQAGGKLIAIEGAVNQIARNEWGLSNKKNEDKKAEGYDLVKTYAERERENLKDFNPGSIYRVSIDNTHPLGFGYGKEYFTLKGDDTVFEFMSEGWNVGIIKKEAHVSGFTGVRAKARLKDGVVFGELPMGSGTVVLLADDILFRNFWENGKLMMANAVFMVNMGSGFHL